MNEKELFLMKENLLSILDSFTKRYEARNCKKNIILAEENANLSKFHFSSSIRLIILIKKMK